MSEDIATNIELFPLGIGMVISIIFVIIAFFSTAIVSMLGLIIASAVAGFLSEKSTIYAVIYGVIIGIISSIIVLLMVGQGNIIFFYVILGAFGGFIGKVIKSNVAK